MIGFDSQGNRIDVDKDLGQNDVPEPDPTQAPTGAEGREALDALVEQYAQMFAHGARTPVIKRPSDVGMEYEDVFFPSMDGTPLEAWFIPADSDRLLIVNHPMTCNRYGFPGHLEPWNTMFGGFEVDFLPELRHLHDAGYNILTYDLRNCGLSSDANGVISGLGLLECRDVVGSLRYVRSRPELASMKLGLFSRCMGGNSTIIAMDFWPEEFADVQALAVLNVVSGKTFIERGAENIGQDPAEAAQMLSERLRDLVGFRLDEETPLPHAHAVKVPTLMAQLRRDFLVHGEQDGQEIFDALGTKTKELLWVEDSNQRFYVYNYFGQHPEKLIAWFDEHIA
ncbi:alpha/beta hydrolase family protein [Actinomyces viscosus]|uniref:Alpha/beta hydrolase family n=2 Tax=Actinomyces viscosus TaxID=1656 RepID=A0A448PLS3_ACTVI|nr:alpha/beta hydrolase [Actinomyces viscosus]VEI16577.1 Alpha/beta hydrolase family [Actinomyces viscosus]